MVQTMYFLLDCRCQCSSNMDQMDSVQLQLRIVKKTIEWLVLALYCIAYFYFFASKNIMYSVGYNTLYRANVTNFMSQFVKINIILGSHAR